MGSTPPPPSINNVQKKAQKKLTQNFWIWVGPPPSLLEMSKRKELFFRDYFPYLFQVFKFNAASFAQFWAQLKIQEFVVTHLQRDEGKISFS